MDKYKHIFIKIHKNEIWKDLMEFIDSHGWMDIDLAGIGTLDYENTEIIIFTKGVDYKELQDFIDAFKLKTE